MDQSGQPLGVYLGQSELDRILQSHRLAVGKRGGERLLAQRRSDRGRVGESNWLTRSTLQDALHDRHRGHGVGPTGVEREMGDDLGDLAGLDPVVERHLEIVWHLDRLFARNQDREGHDTAIAWRQVGTAPKITEKRSVRLPLQGRRHQRNVADGQSVDEPSLLPGHRLRLLSLAIFAG